MVKSMHVTYHPILAAGALTDLQCVPGYIGDECTRVEGKFGLEWNN